MDQPTVNLHDRPRKLASIRALSFVAAFGVVQLIVTGIMDAYPVLYYVIGFGAALVVLACLLAGAAVIATPAFVFFEERQNVSKSRELQQQRFNAEIAALAHSAESTENGKNGRTEAGVDVIASEALRLAVGELARAGATRREAVKFLYGLEAPDQGYRTACNRIGRAANLAGVELPAQKGKQAPIRTFYLTTDD